MHHHDISSSLSCLGCISLIALCAGCGGDTVNLGGGQLGPSVPRGASCVDSPVVPSSIHAQNQQDLENLTGCEEIDGDLLVDIFAGADLSPLSSLKVIDGQLALGMAPAVYAPDNPDGSSDPQKSRARQRQIDQIVKDGYLPSLSGLDNLERAGSLNFNAIAAGDLEPLLGLRRLDIDREESSPVGSVSIQAASHLTSLHGLSNIATIRTLNLSGNAALTSLGGISIIANGAWIGVGDSPLLTSLDELAPITSAYALMLGNLGVSDLSSLSNLTFASDLVLTNLSISELPSLPLGTGFDSIEISDNPNLVDISGLTNVDATSLVISNNAVLPSIPPLPQMRLESFQAISNPALQTIAIDLPQQWSTQSLPNLSPQLASNPIQLIEIEHNDQLTHASLAQGLDQALMLDIYANEALASLDFGTLTHVQELDLDSNPKLADIVLGSLQTVETLSVVDNASLDATTLGSVKTFQATMQHNANDASPP